MSTLKHRQRLFVVLRDLSSPLPYIPKGTRFPIIQTEEAYGFHKGVIRATQRTCAFCGIDCHVSGELDHLVPVSRGGLSVPTNLTLCCPQCNRAKGCKTAEEFVLEMTTALRAMRLRLRQMRLVRLRGMTVAAE